MTDKELENFYREQLEKDIIFCFSQRHNISLEKAMEIYYSSQLAENINAWIYVIQHVDVDATLLTYLLDEKLHHRIACKAVKDFLNTVTLRDAVIMMKYSGESTYSLKASTDVRKRLIQARQTGDYKKINLLGEKMLIKVFDVLYPYLLKGIDTSELEQEDFLQELRILCVTTVKHMKRIHGLRESKSVDTVEVYVNGGDDIYTSLDYAHYYLDRAPGKNTLFLNLQKILRPYVLKLVDSYNSYYERIVEHDTLLDEWDDLAVKYMQCQCMVYKTMMEDSVLLKDVLQDILYTLTERERKVIELRYGLRDDRQRTREEVGQSFGVTRERIKQIERKALRKLRHPSRAKRLAPFMALTKNGDINYLSALD